MYQRPIDRVLYLALLGLILGSVILPERDLLLLAFRGDLVALARFGVVVLFVGFYLTNYRKWAPWGIRFVRASAFNEACKLYEKGELERAMRATERAVKVAGGSS